MSLALKETPINLSLSLLATPGHLGLALMETTINMSRALIVGGVIHKISCVPEKIPIGGYKGSMFAKRLDLIW